MRPFAVSTAESCYHTVQHDNINTKIKGVTRQASRGVMGTPIHALNFFIKDGMG